MSLDVNGNGFPDCDNVKARLVIHKWWSLQHITNNLVKMSEISAF